MNNFWRNIDEAWKKIIYSRKLRFSDSTEGGITGEQISCSSGGKYNATGYVNTTTIESAPTYVGTDDDFYIGVASDKASTIYLPAAARDGKIIVIKAEMKPPIGVRRITITTTDGSTIDGYESETIRISYGSLILIRNNNNWFSIT
ncbi:hypothetical protein EBU95_17675 [bacterium]|nr:hypothetical protein [bacterium]